jgi:hypothetical protein
MENVDLLHHLDIGLITTWYMGSCKLKAHENIHVVWQMILKLINVVKKIKCGDYN